MNFKELILKRESCRNYSDKKVDRDDLVEIVDIASMSPSACNSQPWKFIIVDDEKIKLIPPLLQGGGFNKWTVNVPSFIIICETFAKLGDGVCNDSQHYAQIDIGIAAANLTLAATSQGLSTCIMGCFDEQMLKEIFNIPNEIRIRLVIAVGYAENDNVINKTRKNLDQIISFNNFED